MIGNEFWDLTPLLEKKPPRVKGHIRCPICGSNRMWFKHALPFKRGDNQYRVDVALKCDSCAFVPVFGVHVSEEFYRKVTEAVGNRITYKETGHTLIGGGKSD